MNYLAVLVGVYLADEVLDEVVVGLLELADVLVEYLVLLGKRHDLVPLRVKLQVALHDQPDVSHLDELLVVGDVVEHVHYVLLLAV